MNEFEDTNQPLTYGQMAARRANMTWPEREEQLSLQKLKLLQEMATDLKEIKRATMVTAGLLEAIRHQSSAKEAGTVADKSSPKPTATPAKS